VEHIEVSYWISHRQQALLKHHHLRQIAQLEYDCLPALASTKWYGALVDRKFCQQMLQSKQANHDTPAAVSSEQFACSDNLLHHIHDDGRIHPHFAQIGAVSGGVVCRKPDMQHMAQREQEVEEKDMRRCVIAPPGSLLLALDLSQIELRILAEISKDQTMLHLFAEGKDLNTETAKLMFHLPPETDTKQHLYQDVPVREIAKTINNGLSHGLGVQYLAGCINIPKEEARQLLATYFQIYPGVARWLKQATRLAYQQGYVASRAGRKCVLSTSRTNRSEQVRLERTTRSYPIQATKNDILKRAITIIYDVLPAEAHLVLVVHNEIVIECPEPLVAEVCDLCKAALVQACQADLKLVRIPEPEVLVGPSWKKNGR
jgi:DNA polymerase-1